MSLANETLKKILEELKTQNAKAPAEAPKDYAEPLESANISLGNVDSFLEKLLKATVGGVIPQLKNIRWTIENQSDLFNSFFDHMKQGDLQRLEDQKELLAALKGKDSSKDKESKDKSLAVPLGIAGLLSNLGLDKILGPLLTTGIAALFKTMFAAATSFLLGSLGFLSGLSVGLVTSYFGALFDIFAPNFKKKFLTFFDDFAEGFRKFGTKIDDFFNQARDSLSKLSKKFTFIDEIGDFFKKIAANTEGLAKMFGSGGEIGKIFKTVKEFFGKPIAWLTDALSFFSKFAAIGIKIGKFLGPIGLVISVIDGVYSAVTGFIKGFEEGGFLEGVQQGLTGLFDSVIGGLLDLLKDGAAWVLEKLGFDGAADILKHFSFTEMFTEMFDSIFSKAKLAGEMFGDAVSAYLEFGKDMWKKILATLLPQPAANAPWYSPSKLISAAIPDSVYEFAGISKVKGEDQAVEDIQMQLDPRAGGSIYNRKGVKDGLLKEGYSDKEAEDLIEKARARSLVSAPTVEPVGAKIIQSQKEIDKSKEASAQAVVIQGGNTSSVSGPVTQSVNHVTFNAAGMMDSTGANLSWQSFR